MFDVKMKLGDYTVEGRWHRFFIESDGTDYTFTDKESVSGASISSGYLVMPTDYHIVDAKFDINPDAASVQTLSFGRKIYADGKQGLQLPSATAFDWAYVYVYAYEV